MNLDLCIHVHNDVGKYNMIKNDNDMIPHDDTYIKLYNYTKLYINLCTHIIKCYCITCGGTYIY